MASLAHSFFIFFIRAGKEDSHKNYDEVEFLPDLTTDYEVSCPSTCFKSIFSKQSFKKSTSVKQFGPRSARRFDGPDLGPN